MTPPAKIFLSGITRDYAVLRPFFENRLCAYIRIFPFPNPIQLSKNFIHHLVRHSVLAQAEAPLGAKVQAAHPYVVHPFLSARVLTAAERCQPPGHLKRRPNPGRNRPLSTIASSRRWTSPQFRTPLRSVKQYLHKNCTMRRPFHATLPPA
jgi:hypothetical protein